MAALDLVGKRLQAAYPETNGPRELTILPFGEGPGLRTSARPMLRLLTAAVGLVLLIACANVASLMLARAVSRRRETAVRIAVGAGAPRLVRQWLTESVILALLGGIGGLLLARWGAPLLHAVGIPESIDLAVHPRVLLFTFAIAAASGILAGLAPILQTLRQDTVTALRDEGGSISTGARAARLRRGFVMVQVASSLMLLVGAGLFLRTLANAHSIDLGYRVDATLLAHVNLDVRGYTQEAGAAVYRQILDRLGAMPGVAAVGAARIVVLSGGARTVSVSLDGQPIRPDESNNLDVRVNVVSDGYLESLGIRVLRGRDFTRADDAAAPRVAIVSQRLATRLWPGEDPVGKPLSNGASAVTVVGVVPDTVYRNPLERDPMPFYYVPLAQNYESAVTLHVKAVQGDPVALLPAVRAVVRDVDPRIGVARPQRLTTVFEDSIADQRIMAMLVGVFGGIALLLASVGVYGIMAQTAGQRRSEIGVRLALGARPSAIFGLMLTDGLRLVAIGALIGLGGAFATTRFLESQLFGVRPIDPPTFAFGVVLLAGVATIACLLPARRAMRVDPVVALRGN
jgi:predicted permease